MKTVFSRVKSKINFDEAKALANICKQEKLVPEQLVAAHTEKQFVWKLKEASSSETETNVSVGYPKSDFTEKEATEAAITYLDVTEGNLLPLHTETDYVFGKVRG